MPTIKELRAALEDVINDAVARKAGFKNAATARNVFLIAAAPKNDNNGIFLLKPNLGYDLQDPKIIQLVASIKQAAPSFNVTLTNKEYSLSEEDAEQFCVERVSQKNTSRSGFNFSASTADNDRRNLQQAFDAAMSIGSDGVSKGTVTVFQREKGKNGDYFSVGLTDTSLAHLKQTFPGFKCKKDPTELNGDTYYVGVDDAQKFCRAVREQPYRDYLAQLGTVVKADTWDTKGWTLGGSKVPENIQALRNVLSTYDGSNPKACFDQVSKIMDKANSGSAMFRDESVTQFYKAQQQAISKIEGSQEVVAPSEPSSARTFGAG